MSRSRFAGKDINVKRSGFTLIEIMIVVGIIAIMLVGAVMSVASGRSSMQVKEATRGVIQLSRYASAEFPPDGNLLPIHHPSTVQL